MNILIAPNSMKGSLSAFDFASTVEEALLHYSPKLKIRKVPVADGGDFTGEVLAKALKAKTINLAVHGPLGERVNSGYFVSGKTAIIEMANASGMKLIKREELNPLKTSSYGTGELIFDAIQNGYKNILLAVGGSATVDGGMGMMQALGYQFFDEKGDELTGNGLSLSRVFDFRVSKKVLGISIKIICDVDIPLLGVNGAAGVFGPQKGATPEMVAQLEYGLKNWAQIFRRRTGKIIAEKPGTGAAGGIAIPLISVFKAEIVPGADFILSKINFDEHVKWADLVITGEGKIDAQTLKNKAPFVVAQWAKKQYKPVFAFGGKVENASAAVFDRVFQIADESVEPEFAMNNAKQMLYDFTLSFAVNFEKFIKEGHK